MTDAILESAEIDQDRCTMTDEYFVECECGRRIPVELFEAGTNKNCPSCGRKNSIPSSTAIKELSGDPYPLLSPMEKLRQTLSKGESPFDGICHGCKTNRSQNQTPIEFRYLVERAEVSENAIRPALTGIKLVAGATEEIWQRIVFPLSLCDDCQRDFAASRSKAKRNSIFKYVGMFSLLAGFCYFIYQDPERIASLSIVFWIVGAIAWAAVHRQSRKATTGVDAWIGKIRWATDAISQEHESNLTIGPTVRSEEIILKSDHWAVDVEAKDFTPLA